MVLLQYVGELLISNRISSEYLPVTVGSDYEQLLFEFNILYAFVLVINFIIRKYLVIADEKLFNVPYLEIYVEVQWVADLVCIVISIIYTVLGLDLIFNLV